MAGYLQAHYQPQENSINSVTTFNDNNIENINNGSLHWSKAFEPMPTSKHHKRIKVLYKLSGTLCRLKTVFFLTRCSARGLEFLRSILSRTGHWSVRDKIDLKKTRWSTKLPSSLIKRRGSTSPPPGHGGLYLMQVADQPMPCKKINESKLSLINRRSTQSSHLSPMSY